MYALTEGGRSRPSRLFPPPQGSLALLLVLCTACITMPRARHEPSTAAFTIPGVPVREFGHDRCGPASLAAVLNSYGDQVTVKELDEQLPKGPHGGVLSIDLLLAARAHGFSATLERGSPAVLRRSITAGHPAILLLRVSNLPGVKGDLFHYVVIDGFDPKRLLIRAQIGDGSQRWLSLASLEQAWAPTDHATLLVEPRGGSIAASRRTEPARSSLPSDRGPSSPSL